MLDPNYIIENPSTVRTSLKNRNYDDSLVSEFLELDEQRRDLIQRTESLKHKRNERSKEIGRTIKEKKNAEPAKQKVREIADRIKVLDEELNDVQNRYGNMLDSIPNIPHKSVPVGKDEAHNEIIKEHGEMPSFDFTPRDHLEIGELNRLFALEKASKITGSGFPLFTGRGARLERALISFMLDLHTKDHGYTEISPPYLVNRSSMRGTGQLPKLEQDMYRIDEEDYFLIPTAEVPLTNYFADEVIPEQDLPVKFTGYTACFRREAGSYGKDTRGLIRVHQFDKVELVKFTRPENSMNELKELLKNAETVLQKLGLTYRILALCTGDLSFAAHKCYDIELWAPGSKRWLEVSSCSTFSDFQARRANIQYQSSDRSSPKKLVHTLNGSGVALPRLVIALLETYQKKNGSVEIPEALRPYFGEPSITPQKK